MKICTVVGARPQFIKAATVSRLLKNHPTIQECIIHTGQHYDTNMSEQFFVELDIPTPTHSLNIGSSSHGKQTGLMLGSIEEVLLAEKPDWVLVYGDTNSTLAGALAAVKMHIPVAHVEAGLRSFNRRMPEEINRIMADHVSTLLFPPTENASAQLRKEGVADHQIVNAGDVMYDATLFYNAYNKKRTTLVQQLKLQPKSYCLATIHRAENTDCKKRLNHICQALNELAESMPIILPLHPRTRTYLSQLNWMDSLHKRIHVIDPVGYLDMLALEEQAQWIVTDSGGVQKEAYYNQVPCITLRDETEWVELVDMGWNQLCSPSQPFSLIDLMQREGMRQAVKPLYGDGHAAEKIITTLTAFK